MRRRTVGSVSVAVADGELAITGTLDVETKARSDPRLSQTAIDGILELYGAVLDVTIEGSYAVDIAPVG